MTDRCAVLLVPGDLGSSAAPRGIAEADFGRALLTDVADVLYDLSGVDSLVVCSGAQESAMRRLIWADVPIVSTERPDLLSALQAAAARGYSEAVVVAPDAPDLPQMIIAKMFQSLGSAAVAVAPAHGGGAVAFGAALPAPAWLSDWLGQASVDAPLVGDDVRNAAPRRGIVKVTPGWHRMRSSDDLRRLDPGLEGWEATRALLAGVSPLQEP